MQDAMADDNPFRHLAADRIDAAWPSLQQLDDVALVEHVVEVLESPPEEPADSFVLHAPLELLTRSELLGHVAPNGREAARRRIVEIAAEWNAREPHVEPPSSASRESATSVESLDLGAAVQAGDLDAADRALVALAGQTTVDEFVGLAAETLVGHLGGAGHLSIFLDHLSRLARPMPAAISAGRALIRDLARHPDWTIRWIDRSWHEERASAAGFAEVLADPPSPGDPGSDFIYPTMHLVDEGGLAGELLAAPVAGLAVDEARRQLLRVAAMSMLQDDPAHAPYGWSHCLTMPQATLALAHRIVEPRRAVAVAATYVLGFRATQSSGAIDLEWRPPPPRAGIGLLDGDAHDAVALAWHTDEPERLADELATFAATHVDAHLAKYTLACLHAARTDPDGAPLFRAAAARLAVWWRDHDDPARS